MEYAPGVVIDWPARRVELAAKVVLREGALELLACSPGTKEHESILVVEARPLRIFEAMGLIGLTPGRPPTYDEDAGAWRPAEGDRVRVAIHVGESADVVDPVTWLVDVEKDRRPDDLGWVFCGSARSADGAFAADGEGTVISIVDFPTSLIGLKQSHTAENESLWCRANTAAIPPADTACTILITPHLTEPRPSGSGPQAQESR